MERILIVEDNKTEVKLISKKMAMELDFEIDVAYSMQEAKLFTSRYEYFVALLDINLPDAPDGEIVDYMIEKGVPSVVLSGVIDNEFRKRMMKKDIIDYVRKGRIRDIDNAIKTISRLHMNRNHRVLVVDDSIVFRRHITSLLKLLRFNVITAEDGQKALEVLKSTNDIDIVLTDYEMPGMNGVELTLEIRNLFPKEDMTILAISSSEDEEVSAMFLKNGATDFIKKPFSKEEFSCRLNNAAESLENIRMILRHANRDFLTGLYNRRYFFDNMTDYARQAYENGEKFAIGMVDIDHFKKINDNYGHDVGDRAIVHMTEILRASTNENDIVARFGGEEFCVVLKNSDNDTARLIFERIREKISNTEFVYSPDLSLNMTVSIGVKLNPEEKLDDMIRDADTMLYEAKNGGRNRVCIIE